MPRDFERRPGRGSGVEDGDQHVTPIMPRTSERTSDVACPLCLGERDWRDPLCSRCADALAVQLRRRHEADQRLQPLEDLLR